MSVLERYVALDLGAESGRLMLGMLDGRCLRLEEVHRFPNIPVRVLGSLHWDILHLWYEVIQGLCYVSTRYGARLAGIAVDAWAQDFALLDRNGTLLGLPYHYRDNRTEGVLDHLRELVLDWELYQRTGMPGFAISTLGQLVAMRQQRSPVLDIAHTLLLMPSLFTFWLSGSLANELSIAGMTQLYDLTERNWSPVLLGRLNLSTSLPAPVVDTATVVGQLVRSVAQEVGLESVPIIAAAGHDTAAAAASVPYHTRDAAFISSGTWSVVGKELSQPIISHEAMKSGFINEVGACGRFLFVYNSAGLWPLQECRRQWLRDGNNWSYADLTNMAKQSPPFATLIDPDDSAFMRYGNVMSGLMDFCCRTRQEMPTTPGGIVRSLLEGLALRYRKAIYDLEVLSGRPTDVIHIVGGGSQNALLCQFTADAANQPVLAGPTEAAAIGTVLLQALALGRLSSLSDVREVVLASCELTAYDPHPSPVWDDHYHLFLEMIEQQRRT